MTHPVDLTKACCATIHSFKHYSFYSIIWKYYIFKFQQCANRPKFTVELFYFKKTITFLANKYYSRKLNVKTAASAYACVPVQHILLLCRNIFLQAVAAVIVAGYSNLVGKHARHIIIVCILFLTTILYTGMHAT